MSEDMGERRELPATMLQPVSFDDSPGQEAELRPPCGCADADRTYTELEAEFLRISGELIVARNRVAGLEENGAELLARAEQAERELERLWTPAPGSAAQHAVHCEWHQTAGMYCSCVGLAAISRLRGQRDAYMGTVGRVRAWAHRTSQGAAAAEILALLDMQPAAERLGGES